MISPSERSDAPEGEVIDPGSPGALGTTFPVHPTPDAEPPEPPSAPAASPGATVIAAPDATTVSLVITAGAVRIEVTVRT